MRLYLEIPGIPPSVNSYVRHSKGRHYKTDEASRFQRDIAILAAGKKVEAESYAVLIHVFLGPKQKGDLDNFAKVILDGLVIAGVIHSDAAVVRLLLSKSRAARGETLVHVMDAEATEPIDLWLVHGNNEAKIQ